MQLNQTVIKSGKAKAALIGIFFLFMASGYSGFAQSYTPCTSAVNIFGFGLDGDVNANTPVGVLGDDWFLSASFPGSSVGVVGTTAATAKPPLAISAAAFKAIIQAAKNPTGRNIAYQQGMAMPSGTVINGQLYIDAVGARDNTGVSGAKDSSMFANSSSKNGDSPLHWSLGTSSIPNKNDIIDCGAHLRMDLTSGHVIGYGFATTLSADGNSHTDFEIYRTVPVFDAKGGTVSNSGPAATGGHTTTIFNLDGTLKNTGDILIAIDYINGGLTALASVRVWIDPRNVDGLGHDTAYLNSKALRPFTFTGIWDSGIAANGFGYAEIKPNNASLASCLIAAVENKVTTQAGAWGSLSGSQATYDANIQPLQLVEMSIDFTAFGLGNTAGTSGACEVFLGDLLIKTRSSQSFTADLKDYSGPYPFFVK